MYRYYAVPVRRQDRMLLANPLDGACVLANTPHDASIRLGLPDVGEMFAVWVLGTLDGLDRPEMTLEEAGEICSKIPPSRVFACFGDDLVLPLGIDPVLDVRLEVGRAGGN